MSLPPPPEEKMRQRNVPKDITIQQKKSPFFFFCAEYQWTLATSNRHSSNCYSTTKHDGEKTQSFSSINFFVAAVHHQRVYGLNRHKLC